MGSWRNTGGVELLVIEHEVVVVAAANEYDGGLRSENDSELPIPGHSK
jgi:hypothetical protein